MPRKQFLVEKINGRLGNAKGGKLGGQNRAIQIWGAKIEQL
jgi:hypothetical protein